MNFPGLDPAWSTFHHAAHAAGFLRTWTLPEARAALARDAKVLVVAPTALGDSLLTTPLVETLARHLGPARVSLLVKAPYADLYRDDPRLHRVFSVRGKYRWENLRSDLKADPHALALIANTTEPDLIPWLWHGGARGFLRYRTRWTRYPNWIANRDMLRPPGAPDYATGHAIENNLAMAEALGLAPATRSLALPQISGKEKSRRILLHPGASRAIKRWPVDRWAALADAVVEKFGAEILLTGDLGEKILADQVKAAMNHAAHAQVVAGAWSLRRLAEAQAGALAFLSGDTGPYHLALAVGCPTVTLFAPTDRGSSLEACGPHHADPARHRALQTARLGDAVTTLPLAPVQAETESLLRSLLT
jgi:ADP-heptose:LPS heptosyltransferase